MKATITSAALFVCSAITIVWVVLTLPVVAPLILMACALCFLIASCAIFWAPRPSYVAGTVSGLVALYRFARMELPNFPALNSWILLNLDLHGFEATQRILFVLIILISTSCSLTRLLPGKWTLREMPFRERTWPAFAVCFAIMICWFGASARPYRIPLIADSVQPELAVLHVVKNGIQFHETAFTVHRDGQFYVTRNDRRLLQYRFAVRAADGIVPETIAVRAKLLAQSPQINDLRTLPAKALRSWMAEGWYIRTKQGVVAFTTEYGTQPPKEVLDLFNDLQSVVPAEENLRTSKDVCLGFCYDPLAGLGLGYMNDRCKDQNGTYCK
jgi:hypothetical protein